jgi:hypothetical protein
MAERIPVPFAGAGAGVGELSWGQRELWGAMQAKHTWMPIGTVKPLPPGTTVEDVADQLRFLMAHYPTLRTRLRLDPDGPRQVVAGSGEVTLEVLDAEPRADPAAVAEQVRQRYWDTGYDAADEWPIRMAVVRHRGEPTHRVWVMCHLVADAIGATIMAAELAERDASGSAAASTPLQQASWQRFPAGQRQTALALRHWERLLRTISTRRFPEPDHRTRPRYWNGTFTSRALPLAVRAIAARTRVETSAVLLAVFAIALSQVTGIDPVVIRVVVNNRFRPGLARTVSPIVHNGLCVLGVAGGTVDEVVSQARRQAMAAYKHAYYDPVRLDELVARIRRERGEEVDLGCFFNDRRRRVAAAAAPTDEQVREARASSAFRWDEKQDDKPYDPLFVTVDDTPDGLAILVYIDTNHLSPADAEACLHGMESVALDAARSRVR